MMIVDIDFAEYKAALTRTNHINISGKVSRVVGLVVEGIGPDIPLGGVCEIYRDDGIPVNAEVVGFEGSRILMMPLGDTRGISPGCHISARGESATIKVGDSLLGRVIDGVGAPLDGAGALLCEKEVSIYAEPVNPMDRKRIREPIDLGIRAVNGLLTVGRGQRMGILSGTGVGKSVLLGMMARNTNADVNVIAMIGERGRELKEFIDVSLGEEGMKRSVVVVATSDNSPLLRMRAAHVATAIAEYFRDQGKDVLLMMDSLTRFSMAQREIGLSIGEPPATKGYTPSVFSQLPKLLERAGTCAGTGSITGLYSVLIEGDDISEPISDATRAILDGHMILSRRLASVGHYPAIDLLDSISRVMVDVVDEKHMALAGKFKEIYATYREAEDLINIGAYVAGSNARIDDAIARMDAMKNYLQQGMFENVPLDKSISDLETVLN